MTGCNALGSVVNEVALKRHQGILDLNVQCLGEDVEKTCDKINKICEFILLCSLRNLRLEKVDVSYRSKMI